MKASRMSIQNKGYLHGMNRRLFMKRFLARSRMAFALGFFSIFPVLGRSNGAEIPKMPEDKPTKWTLREIAAGKIHHGKDTFINPFGSAGPRGPWKFLRWKLFSENRFRQFYDRERVTPVTINWEPILDKNGLSITFVKHACVMINDQGSHIYIDPIFDGLSFFYKDFTPLKTNPKEMPKADLILITHGHYDHLDRDALKTFETNTTVLTPLGYADIFEELGMSQHRQMDWFETFRQGKQEITFLPSKHWTMRNPLMGPNRSLWGSYLIKTASGPTLFISGDTAYFEGFKEIGEEFDIDVAILNVGAYEPRWFMRDSHMNPAEAVQAFQDLGAKYLIITHWGTFRLGDEPVWFPPVRIQEELDKQGLLKQYVPLKHGETFFYPKEAMKR